MVRYPSVAALLAAGSLTILTACGDDPAGPVEGQMNGAVVDLPPVASSYTGNIAGDFQFSVSTDGQTWVDVGTLNGITVLLQDSTETSMHGAQDAPTGAFRHVRMRLQAAEVTVDAGSEIDGTNYGSDMKVDVAQVEDLVVERQVTSPAVGSDEAVLVTFDLNSEVWLTAAVVNAGEAANAAIEPVVTVSTRVVPR
jgi:hypothetical protein